MVAWWMQVAASVLVGAAGAFVTVVWEGGAASAVVGTLRADGDGLAAAPVLAGAVAAGGVLTAAVVAGAAGAAVAGAVVDGADVLVPCEVPTCACAWARTAAELDAED